MKKRNVTRLNKEKITMMVSSFLIVAACAMTGVYVNQKEKENVDRQVVDFTQLEKDTGSDMDSLGAGLAADLSADVDTAPNFEQTTGGSVVNPGIGDVSKNSVGESSTVDILDDESQSAESETKEEEDTQKDTEASETMAAPVNYHFEESDGLSWPLQGNVVMNYSMDKAIFFATLQQYKYNPAVIISASLDATVSSPAKGKVISVGTDAEIGNYVEMDLGSGYTITLGQLKDITVSKGESVERSQVIGVTAEPTKYYSVEGVNVYFKVAKDGVPLSPMSMLE